MVKNIIFDWSGVVKDSVLSHHFIINDIFKQFGGKEISLDELKENWKQPYMDFYKKYLPELEHKDEVEAYKKALAKSPKSRAYKGIADLIRKFKCSGIRMSVVSSDLPETLFLEIERFGLNGIFDKVITNVHNKEEGVKKVLDELDYISEETAIIGDSNHEIEVGKKYNLKTIAVTWGFSAEDKLKSSCPDHLIYNLKELEQIIL